MSAMDLNAAELMTGITIRVRGLKVLRFRLWLAAKIFALAGWVAGCNLIIDDGEDAPGGGQKSGPSA